MDEQAPTITNKQRAFVEFYCGEARWNATEAARLAGYRHENVQGPRLLVNVGVKAAINARMAELAMSAEEIVARLAEQATADPADFLDDRGEFDLEKARKSRKTHLLKMTVKRRRDGDEVTYELPDRQAALQLLGRQRGIFNDKLDITSDGKRISSLSDAELLARAAALAGGGREAWSDAAEALGEAQEPDTLLPALSPSEAD